MIIVNITIAVTLSPVSLEAYAFRVINAFKFSLSAFSSEYRMNGLKKIFFSSFSIHTHLYIVMFVRFEHKTSINSNSIIRKKIRVLSNKVTPNLS